MSRKVFLDYVWDKMIGPQIGYSFSVPHDLAYSIEAVQEANLATRYNPLFWACACLCVNAGSSSTDFEESDCLGDEEENDSLPWEENTEDENSDELEPKRTKAIVANYPKIAKALCDIQLSGVKVMLPDINRAQLDFVPDIERNAIIYSLSTITNINQDLANIIINNRPYTSMRDFIDRVECSNVQMISLIKAGCFDEIEKHPRQAIMRSYLEYYASTKVSARDKLTSVHLAKAITMDIIPEEYQLQVRLFNYKKWIDSNEKNAAQKSYILIDPASVQFFESNIKPTMILAKEYDIVPAGYIVKSSPFERHYKELLNPVIDWLNSNEGKQKYYNAECDLIINELYDKYCTGTLSTWEMSSMSFYYSGHELSNLKSEAYNLRSFNNLPEELTPARTKILRSGKEVPVYNLVGIAGTVVGANNNKHIVSLLTPTGVVDVKFYAGAYIHYNKNISSTDKNGKKTMIEKSWFTRGNKLIIYGVRKENSFLPKTDYEKGIRHSVNLIESCTGDYAKLKYEREN